MRVPLVLFLVCLFGCGGDRARVGEDGAALDATVVSDADDAWVGDATVEDTGMDAALPSRAPVFDGVDDYVEIPDADVFSSPTTGSLTVEAWIRPDSLAMPDVEGSGYVHWLGKGVAGQYEWVARMYQAGNSEDRENRISFYAFNPEGELGAGSYFQDPVTVGAWIHYAGHFDATTITIFKNGVQRDSDPLSGYSIVPVNGTAPVRIGTRNLASFFVGAISRVAFYDTKLDAATLASHVAARANGTYDAVVLATPSLVAYYRLDEMSGTVAHDALGHHDGTFHGGVTLAGADF